MANGSRRGNHSDSDSGQDASSGRSSRHSRHPRPIIRQSSHTPRTSNSRSSRAENPRESRRSPPPADSHSGGRRYRVARYGSNRSRSGGGRTETNDDDSEEEAEIVIEDERKSRPRKSSLSTSRPGPATRASSVASAKSVTFQNDDEVEGNLVSQWEYTCPQRCKTYYSWFKADATWWQVLLQCPTCPDSADSDFVRKEGYNPGVNKMRSLTESCTDAKCARPLRNDQVTSDAVPNDNGKWRVRRVPRREEAHIANSCDTRVSYTNDRRMVGTEEWEREISKQQKERGKQFENFVEKFPWAFQGELIGQLKVGTKELSTQDETSYKLLKSGQEQIETQKRLQSRLEESLGSNMSPETRHLLAQMRDNTKKQGDTLKAAKDSNHVTHANLKGINNHLVPAMETQDEATNSICKSQTEKSVTKASTKKSHGGDKTFEILSGVMAVASVFIK